MSSSSIQANKKKIESLLLASGRKGMDKLLKYMDSNGFYTQPASVREHSAYPGGLAAHSLKVRDTAQKLNAALGTNIDTKSIDVATLLHDITKLDNYMEYTPKVSSQEKIGVIQDTKPMYVYNGVVESEKALSHGVNSAYKVSQFIKLTEPEFIAIADHLGPWGAGNDTMIIANAFRNYPLAIIVSMADEFSTFQLEPWYIPKVMLE